MIALSNFASGGYRFLPSVFQYSAGVAASPGYEIRRVRFRQPLPLAEGFDFAEQFIRTAGRPMSAFCACELRSPAPFTEQGFRAFNENYVGRLRTWGLLDGSANPVVAYDVTYSFVTRWGVQKVQSTTTTCAGCAAAVSP